MAERDRCWSAVHDRADRLHGEDGFEIYPACGVMHDLGRPVAAGKNSDIQAIGLGARDTLRLKRECPCTSGTQRYNFAI